MNEQVELIEEKIAVIAAEDRRVRLLMTMTGVGYFTAMLVVTEVGEISRFMTRRLLRLGWAWRRVSIRAMRGRGSEACPALVIRG